GVSLRLSTAEPTVHGTPPALGSKTVSIKTVQKPVHVSKPITSARNHKGLGKGPACRKRSERDQSSIHTTAVEAASATAAAMLQGGSTG
ncbi:unnamed protein product, partial [Ectocarpus sp. 13 AM-2016]